MSWFYLFCAGILEASWAVGLKYTDGFTRPVPTALVIAGIAGSMWLLGQATRDLPIGTAYAVWVGIGATGAAVLGAILFREPVTLARAVCLTMMAISIIGLKLTAHEA